MSRGVWNGSAQSGILRGGFGATRGRWNHHPSATVIDGAARAEVLSSSDLHFLAAEAVQVHRAGLANCDVWISSEGKLCICHGVAFLVKQDVLLWNAGFKDSVGGSENLSCAGFRNRLAVGP